MKLIQSYSWRLAAWLVSILLVGLASCVKTQHFVIPVADYDVPESFFFVPAGDENPEELTKVITSQGQFDEFFGEYAKGMKKIDFKRAVLIYVQGISSKGIAIDQNGRPEINPFWFFLESGVFLDVEIRTNFTDEVVPWHMAFLLSADEDLPTKINITYREVSEDEQE